MQEIGVEVALGLAGGVWESVWVTLKEEDNSFYSDEEICELAEELALGLAEQQKKEVCFVKLLHINYPE